LLWSITNIMTTPIMNIMTTPVITINIINKIIISIIMTTVADMTSMQDTIPVIF